MKAFEIKANGKILDYRITKNLDLDKVIDFFSQKYKVIKIWQESRHVLGIIEKKNQKLFLKLSTTEGISAVTEIEYKWNDEFNRLVTRDINFWVPKNIDSGFYNQNLFYFISDYFDGKLLAQRPLNNTSIKNYSQNLLLIIDLSEFIQKLEVDYLSSKDVEEYKAWFLNKVISWYKAVPQDVTDKFSLNDLLTIVKNGYLNLEKKTRHGDFTPWHMFELSNGKIGLIDGEHAMKNGVEYYDISYLIQRTFSVLKKPGFAKKILDILVERKYNMDKLKVILASRAIGGFLDESLVSKKPDYTIANDFKNWFIKL